MSRADGKTGTKGTGTGVLLVLAAAAVGALAAGYIRSGTMSELVEALPGQQKRLEECRDLAAEYSGLRRQQVDPSERDKYVRTLMEKIAQDLGIRAALGRIRATEIQKTDIFVETKYGAELRGVSLKNTATFLYRIQTAGKNLVPAELIMRRDRKSDRWTAHLAVHAVSALK